MSQTIYLWLHVIGVFMVFGSTIGALVYGKLNQSTGKTPERKLLMITHGIGLLIVLVAGFGLLAKLHIGFENWVWAKIVIWLFFGYAIVPAIKGKAHFAGFYILFLVLASLAAYLGINKPF